MAVHHLFPAAGGGNGQSMGRSPDATDAPVRFPGVSERFARTLERTGQAVHGDVKVARSDRHAVLRLGPICKRLDRNELARLIDRLTAIADEMDADDAVSNAVNGV